MANKSYKQLYEECQTELKKLRELTKGLTPEEVLALRAVAHGCNTNRNLNSIYGSTFLEISTNKTMSFKDALITVYELIERLEDNA